MTTPVPVRALIFDLDGTLADTLSICIAAFQETVRRHSGQRMSASEVAARFGPSEEGMLRTVLRSPDFSPSRYRDATCREIRASAVEPAMATYLAEYERLHTSCTAPFDGLSKLLDRMAEHRVRLAVVTGKGPRSAAISLRAIGLARRFERVEVGAASGSIKPQAIRRLLDSWRLPPPACAYVGDSPIDVRAAREAGVVAIAAAWRPDADPRPLAAEGPDFLFQSVEEFAAWAGRPA
jgi:phosphoglycolate phosphatase/pyrophosphatase PpaX